MLCPGFAESEADSSCTPYLQDYFLGLKRLHPDWRISIVAIQYPFQKGKYLWNGLEVNALGGKNRKLNRFKTWRKVQKVVAELHRGQKIDVLHSFWLREAAYLGAKMGANLGVKHIASALGQDIGVKNRYLKGLADTESIFTCQTQEAMEALSAALPKHKLHLFRFGIDPSKFSVPQGKTREIDLLAVGSLVAVKRHDRFVRVVNNLRRTMPQLKAVLVGEGELRGEIEAQIKALGLENTLELKGQVPREEVFELMKSAKVLVHTSASEGLGYVYSEALACGCHLVTTPVGVYEASEKWRVSQHTIGLAEAAKSFLTNPVDFEGRIHMQVADTVATFSKIYFGE